MHTFKVQDIEVNITSDILEWGREFYGIEEGHTIHEDYVEELTSTSMGFAYLQEKQIWVFIPTGNKPECYRSTIAHEVGHVIEGGFKKNPSARMIQLHEKKAEHYENYYMLVSEIIEHVENNILNNKKL